MSDTTMDLGTDVEIVSWQPQDANRKTHIVRPTDNGVELGPKGVGLTGRDIIDMARLAGTEVVALCGARFVPDRDPKKHPACEDCIRIAGEINRGERP